MTGNRKGCGTDFPIDEALELVRAALREDVGPGDWTTLWTVPPEVRARGRISSKEEGIICGLKAAELAFREVDHRIAFRTELQDGSRVRLGDAISEVKGPARGMLTAERTALNFLQRLSGIATLTARYVEAVWGTGAKILDTRKTTPGWRLLEKYAVRCGGGENHRIGLYDMVLIKDNHIALAGGIAEAVGRVREGMGTEKLKVEVEVRTLEELEEALASGVDRVLLDNMSPEEVKEAVRLVRSRGKVEVETSGGISLENVRAYAEAGVDYISVGALTHSADALDISMDIYLL
ncbi:MAG: carboxylating nicotinate-nucleotide diphosphorylase [Candidatus Latescibacterota bacterium]|nr:MAG: carboxylating nicotinate-nucleotide diphosphorylase [Candidatus Latescibacterota bacterium]